MSDFFDFNADCFDKPSPPALIKTPAVADDSVPAVPEPVFQCPPPEARPGPVGDLFLHIKIVDPPTPAGGPGITPQNRVAWRHAWVGVEARANGSWTETGEAGSPADDSGAVALDGCRVRANGEVYLARRVTGSKRVVFNHRRSPSRIRLTSFIAESGNYTWEGVSQNADGDWTPTGEIGDVDDPAIEAGDREVDDDPDATYAAQRDLDGNLIFDAATGSRSGGGGEPSGGTGGRVFWCKTPSEGVAAAEGDFPGVTATQFVADVFAGENAGMSLVTADATVRWWLSYGVGGGRVLPLSRGADGNNVYDAITNPCPCGTRLDVYVYGECEDNILPAPGATVDVRSPIEDESVAITTTNAQGHAIFSELPPNVYTVIAYRDGCDTNSAQGVSTFSGGASAEIKLTCSGQFGRICATLIQDMPDAFLHVDDRPPVPLTRFRKACVNDLPPGDYQVSFTGLIEMNGDAVDDIPQTIHVDCAEVSVTPRLVGIAKFFVKGCGGLPIPDAEFNISGPSGSMYGVTGDDGVVTFSLTEYGDYAYSATPPNADRFSSEDTSGIINFAEPVYSPQTGLHYPNGRVFNKVIALKPAEGYTCCATFPRGYLPEGVVSLWPMKKQVMVSTAVGSTVVEISGCFILAHINFELDKCEGEPEIETPPGWYCFNSSGGTNSPAKVGPPAWVSKPSCLTFALALGGVASPAGTLNAMQLGDGRPGPARWYRADLPQLGGYCNCDLPYFDFQGVDKVFRLPAECVSNEPYTAPVACTVNSEIPYSVTLHFGDTGNGEWERVRKCSESENPLPTGNKVSVDVTVSEAP